jgi:hypothetical protein
LQRCWRHKPEIDTLDSAVNSEKDALRHYEIDRPRETIFGTCCSIED